jgi:CheY-like chemotaxis protein
MAREILIADGNKAAHKAFEDIFKETDYNLVFSENGEDALLKMKLFKPALVIADITMSDKDGKELCQMLKEDPNLNKVPFVLLGGPFDQDIEEEKKQVRADGAITKPLQREPILKLVDGLLMAEPTEGAREVEEEILDLQPMAEVTESVSSQGEEEIIDLLDIMEEPVTKPEEVPPRVSGEAMNGGEVRESEEGGLVREEAIADLELPEDMGLPKAEEAIQTPEMERPGSGSEIPEMGDLKTEPAEMEGKIFPEEEMDKVRGIEDQYPGPLEGTSEPGTGALGAEEIMEELSAEGMGELPQDIAQEKGLEEALAEHLEELPVEGASEPGTGALGAEGGTEELPAEGMGE